MILPDSYTVGGRQIELVGRPDIEETVPFVEETGYAVHAVVAY
jgi:hypothetical protein